LQHRNPTICQAVEETGGSIGLGNPLDGSFVAHFAVSHSVDYAIVNQDDCLEAGVVDALIAKGIRTYGPTREGAQIEWSKSYARDLVQTVDPSFNPVHRIVDNVHDLSSAIRELDGKRIVVKPDGLTSGRGVKVVGKHLADNDEAVAYAASVLTGTAKMGRHHKVIVEEALIGHEFTIMGLSDGDAMVLAPATYDYPYRFDGDKGPGTGGMGCFTQADGLLPFLLPEDVARCQSFMLNVLRRHNRHRPLFNGVLNGGFFKCPDGSLKLMEFNARFGDPECLNIMSILATPFFDVLEATVSGRLSSHCCRFRPHASLVVYIVPNDYALEGRSSPILCNIDEDKLRMTGADILYGSCERVAGRSTLRSVGTSRLAAIVASGPSLTTLRTDLYQAIEQSVSGSVQWRRDIGLVA
jgi:phosphoribosylamine--glycine ligase